MWRVCLEAPPNMVPPSTTSCIHLQQIRNGCMLREVAVQLRLSPLFTAEHRI